MAEFILLLKNNPLLVLLIGFMAVSIAILIHRLLKQDMRYLKKDIDNLDTKLSKEIKHLKKDIDNLDTKLSKEIKHTRELLVLKLEPIEKQLTNHVTDTDKKINKLAEGQVRLEAKLDRILEKK